MDLAGDFMTTVRRCESWRVPTSGFAADTAEAFVFDRVLTALDHRRKGLGRALMTALREARRDLNLHELLIATAVGRALYRTSGWETLSTYSTASIPMA
ncbi:GNAT family N-acetyltransferase [Sphingomonas sp. H160509]|uniref:GNAT family N-acetyltransferase n=1 Tax=Sphingomonas sp. H160509 TaxID=2955313 RepID=UPI002096C283|nr:GNAT family N-acetyltransferase [Sphingomonas sp. H160509]MDD1450352.1 GNAT family N-acetyltransferase [Sphingomonas sp. H160509]